MRFVQTGKLVIKSCQKKRELCTMTEIVKVQGLQKKFGKFQALKDVSFTVNAGEVVGLELMNREEIDTILLESFLYHKPITLQLNTKDEFGRFLDPVEGQFLGEAYEDYFVLNEQAIYWTDVRHISIKEDEKWFKVDYFQDEEAIRNKQIKKERNIEEEIKLIKNEYYQDFADDD